MSKYAVYELFDYERAPKTLEFNGHLKGSLVGECDENPLEVHADASNARSRQAQNEFSPLVNIVISTPASVDIEAKDDE